MQIRIGRFDGNSSSRIVAKERRDQLCLLGSLSLATSPTNTTVVLDHFKRFQNACFEGSLDLAANFQRRQPPNHGYRLRSGEGQVERASSFGVSNVLHQRRFRIRCKSAQEPGKGISFDNFTEPKPASTTAPPRSGRFTSADVVVFFAEIRVVANLRFAATDRLDRQHSPSVSLVSGGFRRGEVPAEAA